MTRTEASIERACVDFAKRRGWLVRKMNGMGYRSWPDRLFIGSRDARNFWVEFKRPDKAPTPGQWKIINALTARGEIVHVIDDVDAFKRMVAR